MWSQFHYGSIHTLMSWQQLKKKQCLNSTMVRFIQWKSIDVVSVGQGSQFHYGSIHTFITAPTTIDIAMSQFHYGSIHTLTFCDTVVSEVMSQFHYGSIHTKRSSGITLEDLSLNSTMVRFIQKWLSLLCMGNYCLNSTMVRFIHGISTKSLIALKRSQFHYGSIHTRKSPNYNYYVA